MSVYKAAFILDGTYNVVAIMDVFDGYEISGFYLIEIKDGVYCAEGSYYNPDDGMFYDDPDYTTINGVAVSDGDYSYSSSGD